MSNHSMLFRPAPVVLGYGSVAGKKESEGPLAQEFDLCEKDTRFAESTWEKAETKMQQVVLKTALRRARLTGEELDLVFSGDLLNQCIGSSFCLRDTGIPTLGLYGACSTMAEGLVLASMSVSGGFADTAAALTSSHYAASERQYRFPLGYGGQRAPTAQWTVTGAGCVILGRGAGRVRIRAATVGTIVDAGITDAGNMGAAMAPAAAETIRTHLRELGRKPEDYDLIVTGDLGAVGAEIAAGLLEDEGYPMGDRYRDCGLMIYDRQRQDVHAGGSGCGCSAVVLCGRLLRQMEEKKCRNLLFCGTGALFSPVSSNQGETIPGVCHAVWLSTEEG